MENKLCRIAVFYDGNYFFNVSNYYLYQHPRKARISFKGLHDFILAQIAQKEGIDVRHCQIVDAAYFRGRLTAQQAQEQDKLFADRVFEDVLMRADITLFQRHLKPRKDGGFEEKGIDVWLALEAFEMTNLKKYDVCVLVAGDTDFVPLVNKLNTLGARVMLMAWNFSYEKDGRERSTRASTELMERVNYPIAMDEQIDARGQHPEIKNLFMDKPAATNDEGLMGPTEALVDAQPQVGAVVNLFPEKGYGFIKGQHGEDHYFFHFNHLSGVSAKELNVGTSVQFTLGRNERGPVAQDVMLLAAAPNDRSTLLD